MQDRNMQTESTLSRRQPGQNIDPKVCAGDATNTTVEPEFLLEIKKAFLLLIIYF